MVFGFPPQLRQTRGSVCRRFRRWGCVFVIVLIIVTAIPFECVGDLTEEALLFLGLLLVFDTSSGLGVPTGCGRGGRTIGGWRRQWLLRGSAKDSGEESLCAARLVAGIMWLGSGDEGDGVIVGTGRRCQPVCNLVELNIDHAVGLVEGLHIGVLRERHGLLHELSPDGGGGLRAAQANIAVVVIAYPNHAQQVAGVAGEPSVMRGSRLAGCGSGEAA